MLTVLNMTVLQSYQLTTLIHFLKVPFQRKWSCSQVQRLHAGVTSGLTEQMQVSPADHLSADALHYLAGYVAFKLKHQHPDLGQVGMGGDLAPNLGGPKKFFTAQFQEKFPFSG